MSSYIFKGDKQNVLQTFLLSSVLLLDSNVTYLYSPSHKFLLHDIFQVKKVDNSQDPERVCGQDGDLELVEAETEGKHVSCYCILL